MKKTLLLTTLVVAGCMSSWAGPSIFLGGNQTFTVNYNGFNDDGDVALPNLSASVLYTISGWTQTGDAKGGKTAETKFTMTMNIVNNSSVQSRVSALGWRTNPDAEGSDGNVTGIFDEFNDDNPSDAWESNGLSPYPEFCLSDQNDICRSSKSGVTQGKKGTTSALVVFGGHAGINFQNFFLRWDNMDYEIGRHDYSTGIGYGDVATTVTPEPGTFAALALGVGAAVLAARRRKRA